MISVRFAGLILSSVSPVLMRSPPITNGYSCPSCSFTFPMAARIAAAFSSLLKSVNGSLRNSVGIIFYGTHASGVQSLFKFNPARRRRAYPFLRHPLAGLLQFLNLAFDDFPFQGGHPVKKHYAVAVIGFMQHAARCQLCAVKFELFAVNVVRANNRPQVALNAKKDSGKR